MGIAKKKWIAKQLGKICHCHWAHSLTFAPINKIGYEMAFPHQTVAACHKFRYIFIILPLTFLLGTHFDDTPLDQMKEF